MKEIGFIKLDRKILSWRWYNNVNTFKVFMHLLISANFADAQYEEHTIRRGQVVTGVSRLSTDTGLTVQMVRTALKHLKSTNDITITTTPKFSIITIENYEQFVASTEVLTTEQQTINTQVTCYQQQYKKKKKNKNKKNNFVYSVKQDKRVHKEYIDMLESKSLFKD